MDHADAPVGVAGRALAAVLIVAVPVVVWPGVDRPFSLPKLWVFGCGTITLLLLGLLRRSVGAAVSGAPASHGWTAFAWMASFALSGALAPFVAGESLVVGLAGPLFWVGLVASGVTSAGVAGATVGAVAVVSAVTLAQWWGLDPFAAAGWVPAIQGGSARLRTYGTLGNPNFVAAWLATTVPFVVALAWQAHALGRRALSVVCGSILVMGLGAVAATGSRGGALGLAVALSVVAMVVPRRPPGARRRALGAIVAVAIGVSLAWCSTARPHTDTLAGRAYIWRIAAPHAFERPVAGWGPGAFELVYHDWQGTAPTHESDRVFAGPQQRAHNDYLEALVERGVPGFAATCLLVGVVLAVAIRQQRRGTGREFTAAAVAAVLAVGAVALVDFPLARPAEIAALWAAVAVLTLETKDAS